MTRFGETGDLPGRGDVNPYGIPMPNPHEREGPEEEDCCVTCGEPILDFYEQRAGDRPLRTRCQRCNDSMEYDRLERESGR
jgi:hypothetical protein